MLQHRDGNEDSLARIRKEGYQNQLSLDINRPGPHGESKQKIQMSIRSNYHCVGDNGDRYSEEHQPFP
jgi:hypothetical protein